MESGWDQSSCFTSHSCRLLLTLVVPSVHGSQRAQPSQSRHMCSVGILPISPRGPTRSGRSAGYTRVPPNARRSNPPPPLPVQLRARPNPNPSSSPPFLRKRDRTRCARMLLPSYPFRTALRTAQVGTSRSSRCVWSLRSSFSGSI